MNQIGNIPVRKVVRRSTVRVVGYHASQKMKCLVPWESQIERDYFEWLEVDPNVIGFYAQPETFQLNEIRYTPDAFVITHKGVFFAEVKPDKVLDCEEDMDRLWKIEQALIATGRYFKLVLESDVRAQPLRSNVIVLNRYRRRPLSRDHQAIIQQALSGLELTFNEFTARTGLPNEVLMQGIAQGFLRADLTQEFTTETTVTIQQGRLRDDTCEVGGWE